MSQATAAIELPFARLPGNLAPLGYRNYALFWIGFFASNAGRWAEQTGAVWLVYQMTDSPLLLGLLGAAKAIPTLVLAPFAGVIVDRVDQRKLVFITQGTSLFLSAGLGILIVTGHVQVWMVYVEILATGCISAFDVSARQTLFPRVVPRNQLPAAVTLTSLASRASALVGPAIGGLAIAYWGVAAPFFINAATFLALMGALALMRWVPAPPVKDRLPFVTELKEGITYMRRTPILSGILRMQLVFGAFQMNQVLIAIVATEVLGAGPAALGFLLSAPAFGAIAGLVVMLAIGQRQRPGKFVVFVQWGYALATAAFAFSTSFGLSFALIAVTGFLDVVETVTRLSIAQLASPPGMNGRVMSNMRVITGGIGPLAQTQSGIVAGLVGGPMAALIAAVALATSAFTTGFLNRAVWKFRISEVMMQPGQIEDEEAIASGTPTGAMAAVAEPAEAAASPIAGTPPGAGTSTGVSSVR